MDVKVGLWRKPLLSKTWHFLLKVNAIIIFNKIYSIVLIPSNILFISCSKFPSCMQNICSNFGVPKNKVWHCFHCFPIYFWLYVLTFTAVSLKNLPGLLSLLWISTDQEKRSNDGCDFTHFFITEKFWTLTSFTHFTECFKTFLSVGRLE